MCWLDKTALLWSEYSHRRSSPAEELTCLAGVSLLGWEGGKPHSSPGDGGGRWPCAGSGVVWQRRGVLSLVWLILRTLAALATGVAKKKKPPHDTKDSSRL